MTSIEVTAGPEVRGKLRVAENLISDPLSSLLVRCPQTPGSALGPRDKLQHSSPGGGGGSGGGNGGSGRLSPSAPIIQGGHSGGNDFAKI